MGGHPSYTQRQVMREICLAVPRLNNFRCDCELEDQVSSFCSASKKLYAFWKSRVCLGLKFLHMQNKDIGLDLGI